MSDSDNVTPLRPPKYHLRPGASITDLPELEWRIKGVLPSQGLAVIYGPSASGKSFLALDMAAAIVLGGPWFGHVVKRSTVVYIPLEGEGGIPKRIKAWQQQHHETCPDGLYFLLHESFKITSPVDVAELASVTPSGSVIIIDTLNRAAPFADENGSRDMGAILSGCKQLQKLTNGLVILIHHTGKDETRGLRGHSSLIAAVDASIEVARLNDDSRTWSIAKAKDGEDGTTHQFNLYTLTVGQDSDGDEITSCAIQPLDGGAPPIPIRTGLKDNQKAVLAAIEALLVDGPISWDDALAAASGVLSHIDSQHRRDRARSTLNSLIKMGKLVFKDDMISFRV